MSGESRFLENQAVFGKERRKKEGKKEKSRQNLYGCGK